MADFIERILILDRRAFGLKVMEWADGTLPFPETLEEAQAQLTGILKFPLPSYITGLKAIPTVKEVWTIKLPPPDMLADTRARIADGQPYTLADDYRQRIEGELTDDNVFFEFRVGDYTCSLCA